MYDKREARLKCSTARCLAVWEARWAQLLRHAGWKPGAARGCDGVWDEGKGASYAHVHTGALARGQDRGSGWHYGNGACAANPSAAC